MKKTLTTMACAMAAFGAFAQGQVNMLPENQINDNTGAPAGPNSGGTFQVELVVDSAGTTITTPTEIAASINPLNAGFFNGPGATGLVTFDGTGNTAAGSASQTLAPGSTITYQIEAWSGAATYAAASKTAGDLFGISAINTYTLGGGSPPLPSNPLTFATFNMAPGVPTNSPEPTTLALGAMGLGAALMFRRRK
jgi:MYXO-CTERM domain-containing protein